jgi:integrase
MGYRAQIVRKKGGKIIWRETQTFDREQGAKAWLARREEELTQPGAMERRTDPPLRVIIDRYITESEKEIGRTKAQVLRSIQKMDIADLAGSKITSAELLAMMRALDVAPATRQNYLSHLGAVFAIARPAWGYPLDEQVVKDAFKVAHRLGITSKSSRRDRRPTIAELDRLIEHFETVRSFRPLSIPMRRIIPFAIFSTRRQEEITLLRKADYDKAHSRVLVRDMKHPGEKIGNNIWCELTPEAAAIVDAQIADLPESEERIFPYSTDAISAAFTRACKTLEIADLHFHDLRHEGASWLFEKGDRGIPQVQLITGHRTWGSLQRYSHIRQSGDKYENWKWRKP